MFNTVFQELLSWAVGPLCVLSVEINTLRINGWGISNTSLIVWVTRVPLVSPSVTLQHQHIEIVSSKWPFSSIEYSNPTTRCHYVSNAQKPNHLLTQHGSEPLQHQCIKGVASKTRLSPTILYSITRCDEVIELRNPNHCPCSAAINQQERSETTRPTALLRNNLTIGSISMLAP